MELLHAALQALQHANQLLELAGSQLAVRQQIEAALGQLGEGLHVRLLVLQVLGVDVSGLALLGLELGKALRVDRHLRSSGLRNSRGSHRGGPHCFRPYWSGRGAGAGAGAATAC